MIELRARGLLLAYHDRSDGGLLVTLLEMAFAGHCGLDARAAPARPIGARAAVRRGAGRGAAGARRRRRAQRCWPASQRHGLADCVQRIGAPSETMRLRIRMRRGALLDEAWSDLRRAWSETSLSHAPAAR